MDDEYYTIKREAIAEIKIKGSRFVGESFLADSVALALEKLDSVRRREYSATHHCYAYRVGLPPDVTFKYSDDGEPGGTAGKPIYDVIGGLDLNNTLVVVTRYFGGVKLGAGGLVHAYRDAAKLVLKESGRRLNFIAAAFHVQLAFPAYDQWMRVINQLDATVLKSDFSDTVAMDVSIRRSRASGLKAAFDEITAGKGRIEPIEKTPPR